MAIEKQFLDNELQTFAENINAKEFDKDLRDLVLEYIKSETGRKQHFDGLMSICSNYIYFLMWLRSINQQQLQ